GHDGHRPRDAPDGWVDEGDIPAHLRSRRVYGANGSKTNPHGTAYVAALGRVNDYPPVVAGLIDQLRRTGGEYHVTALTHDRQYAGYQVTFLDKEGNFAGALDVTGPRL